MDFRPIFSSSAGNLYAVTSDGAAPLLLEAGVPFRELQRALHHQVTGLAGCLLTHSHQDHARAAADLMRAGVDVYASRGTLDALGLTGHRAHATRALEQLQVGPWTVLPFDVPHDAEGPLGFLVARGAEKLCFVTDAAYCPYRFSGVTVFAVEANHSRALLRANVAAGVVDAALARRIGRTHLSLERCIDLLRANDLSRVEQIWLLHLSDTSSDAAAFKDAVQRACGRPVYIADREEARV